MHKVSKKVLKMEYATWWDPLEKEKVFIAYIQSQPDFLIFVPNFPEMYISCVMMYSTLCCWRVAAAFASAIATVGINPENFSEVCVSRISTTWYILVSMLLLKSDFMYVCVCVCVHVPILFGIRILEACHLENGSHHFLWIKWGPKNARQWFQCTKCLLPIKT